MTTQDMRLSIAHQIKEARKVKGFSQADLAKLCGISKSYIEKLEAGQRSPSLSVIILLQSALDIVIRVD